MIKSIVKSKTMIFALLLAMFGALQATLPALDGVISQGAYGYITVATGVIVAGLRVVTTQPLKDK